MIGDLIELLRFDLRCSRSHRLGVAGLCHVRVISRWPLQGEVATSQLSVALLNESRGKHGAEPVCGTGGFRTQSLMS